MVVRAPAFKEGLTWFNSKPLTLLELRGKYVLLDFFTFGCINCINNLQTIKALHLSFGDALVVVGVHTGKFLYEKEPRALQETLLKHSISYAVVNDPDHLIADVYAARGWPTTILIDNRGYIAHQSSGEQKLSEWRGRLSACGLSAKHKHLQSQNTERSLSFPQKVLTTDDFLVLSNTNRDEVWLSDYSAHVFAVISAERPMGCAYHDGELYICEKAWVSIYNVARKEKRVFVSGLRNPYDLVVQNKSLVVALAGSHVIHMYDLSTGSLMQTYGNRFEALRDGVADVCQLAQPSGLALMDNILYFVDAESSSLRKIEDAEVSTLIGEGLFTFGDSNSDELLLQHPQDLCVGIVGDGCGGGRIFLCDTFNNKVKAYFPDDGSMMTLLENLNEPSGIAKKGCQLYIANTNQHEILSFDLSSRKMSKMLFSFKKGLATPHQGL